MATTFGWGETFFKIVVGMGALIFAFLLLNRPRATTDVVTALAGAQVNIVRALQGR